MRSLLVVTLLAACGGSAPSPTTPTTPPTPAEEPRPDASSSTTTATTATTSTTTTTQTPVTVNSSPSIMNAPEITKSPGVEGGIVLLWPRVPSASKDESRALAAAIQARLRVVVGRAHPGKPIDVRPEPERACGRQGCTAIAVGASLLRNGGGCAVVVTVAAPGNSPTTIIPWVGALTLKSSTVPFREPPETVIAVNDFENCGAVEGALGTREGEVEAAIRAGK